MIFIGTADAAVRSYLSENNYDNLSAEKIKVPNNYALPFEIWVNNSTEGLNNGFMWDEIESIKEIFCDDVRDITPTE